MVVVGALLAGCSGDDPAAGPVDESSAPQGSSGTATSTVTQSTTPTATAAQPTATRRLDSIAVLGHSGATGTLSDPEDPSRDAHENSWATGSNPEVQSIYLRLLQDHPALKGHNYNHAINGSGVDQLELAFEGLLDEVEVLPDVVLIQVIDNDMRCDGTDAQNYGPFARTLDRALTRMEDTIPGVQFFLTSQWATVETWTAWAVDHVEQVFANSGTGPCHVFDGQGTPRPAGMRSLQRIADSYWSEVESVCAEHPGCFTDGGAQKSFVPTDRDVALDFNHLSIAGHRKYAAIAWQAFPDEIKERP